MKNLKKVVILCGGESGEREVSIHSAQPVFEALKSLYPVRLEILERNELPKDLDPKTDFIFPLIHGDFGEDGQLQALLDKEHFSYIGSDVKASQCCMHKLQSKKLAQQLNIPVLPGIPLLPKQSLDQNFLEKTLKSTAFVLKPEDKGSSIGVHLCPNFETLKAAWEPIDTGHWMIEPYIQGCELTVGLLQGRALGVVEIRPKQGFYNYHNKYTEGASEYLYPAPIDTIKTKNLQMFSEQFFAAAQCLDFGRADFIMDDKHQVWFLEMNTIPGMTVQSLLPKSAACVGIPFIELLQRLIEGTQRRFE